MIITVVGATLFSTAGVAAVCSAAARIMAFTMIVSPLNFTSRSLENIEFVGNKPAVGCPGARMCGDPGAMLEILQSISSECFRSKLAVDSL